MIQFPETAATEWQIIAEAANAATEVRKVIERGTAVANAVERLRVNHEARVIHQQELDAASTPSLEMISLDSYMVNPAAAPVDLIEGVVKANGLTIMLGPSGSGKSTIALQMLYSLLTGNDWLGQKAQRVNGAVGVVSYDMDAALVLDWMSGFPNVDPARVRAVNAHKRGNPLGVPALRQQIVADWKARNVRVVVIDSFSASFFAMDQNDAGATMAHYRDLILFALTEVGADALVVITHSTDKTPHIARGSTVHQDVADSIVSLAVNPPGDPKGKRSLRMVKYRAALGQQAMSELMITPPDAVTHLVDIDTGAMALAGMHISGAAAFAPPTHETPDISPDEDEEADL